MKELLSKLPKFDNKTKNELLEILLKAEYGYIPPAPDETSVIEESRDISFCAGKADLVKLKFTCYGQWGEFSFPAYYVCPKNAKKPVPAFIHINFRDMIPDRYQPTEELIDAGYATLTFCHNDITQDNWDFTEGFAGLLYPNGERRDDQCGKIGLWAWAAIRLMDYAVTIPEIDKDRISVVGHSRLGKTALLAGALDERFYCAISNDSGCSGAALAREKTGETVAGINTNWGYWFCNNYKKYSDNEDKMEFDQHFLLAANYPHKVYVCSAEEDKTAHPRNEYLSCVAASEFFEKNGMKGFIHPDRLAETGDVFNQGDIGYHVRSGRHYLSREDWNRYLEFLEK